MRIRPTLLAILAVSVSLLPAAAARADSNFEFFGAGFGHGLGMSQWGAYGLAQRGWSHEQILTHYYSGTSVVVWAKKQPSVRVGLTQGRQTIHVEARGGPVSVTLGKSGATIGSIPGGETWTFGSSQNAYRVLDEHGAPVGGQLWGGESENLVISFAAGSRAFVPEALHAFAHGRLEFNLSGCSACRLRLIAVVPMEQYLYGLAEVSSSWPMEAMEAQADAARTYALRRILTYGQHRPTCNCGLYATTADQAYAGWDKEFGLMGDRWVQAVDATAGEVVEYGGQPIQAFYTASSGGYTENNENVWGGTPLPYLRGVCDPGDYVPENSSRTWTLTFTAASLTSRLHAYTGDIGTITGFEQASRGVSGRIIDVTVVGTSGFHAVSARSSRPRSGSATTGSGSATTGRLPGGSARATTTRCARRGWPRAPPGPSPEGAASASSTARSTTATPRRRPCGSTGVCTTTTGRSTDPEALRASPPPASRVAEGRAMRASSTERSPAPRVAAAR
ncbi:MAG: SpoIID/LytB domain-containing protein [Actinomycetota bacterium]|nr:SpoIID/LytB domain-containing protein [Actinomycetota bacterium]